VITEATLLAIAEDARHIGPGEDTMASECLRLIAEVRRLRDGTPGDRSFLDLVQAEASRAKRDHGRDFASDHEAFAVLLEEVEEVKACVWRKRTERDRVAMAEELVQIAAVAMKWAEQLGRRTRPAPEGGAP
jgi:hypothetical protein